MRSLIKYLFNWLLDFKLSEQYTSYLALIITLIIAAAVAIIGFYVLRAIIVRIFIRIASRTKTDWDDILLENKVFHRFAHLFPPIMVYSMHTFLSKSTPEGVKEELLEFPWLSEMLLRATHIYFLIAMIAIINSFLNAVEEIYFRSNSNQKSIKSYIQVIKILVYIFGGILIISSLINQDPTKLLAGLTAATAILLLIFKDTILNFVAGIKLSADKMIQLGDWIEMPNHRADGVVTEMNLNTVKIQNWDKTITMIPTYTMVSESFINWKGIEESGARRIKRFINIDMTSIRFCDEAMLNKFEQFNLIQDLIISKKEEIKGLNLKPTSKAEVNPNYFLLPTNIGIFRRYVEAYIKSIPLTHNELTTIVRNLQPTETGLPIEITTFSNDTSSVVYENFQSELMDHILSVIPIFGLRIYQQPSGFDVAGSEIKHPGTIV
ncbi:MAG: mechanosensitive ion channel [Bacteroidota bacterium]|nr:mechanosensitive ion channel [Bacteroidota bacterium]